METSPSIKIIAEAFKAFQEAAPTVSKDAKANYGKYATIGNVIDTIKEPLAKNGLSFSQMPDGSGLTTIIMHTSGEWIRSTANIVMEKPTPQGQGSAITYMRRYALSAALGIATEDDDDGTVASTAPQTAKTAPRTVAKPVADPDIKDKKEIASLMIKLGQPITADNAAERVLQATDEELIPANYSVIIDKLNSLLAERNEK